MEKATIAAVDESFLHDCEPAVLAMYRGWIEKLKQQGAEVRAGSPIFGKTHERSSWGSRGMKRRCCTRGTTPTLSARLPIV